MYDIELSLEVSVSGKAFYGIMRGRSRLNTSEVSIRYRTVDYIGLFYLDSILNLASINLQTPIIYPSVVFFSIRIVSIIFDNLLNRANHFQNKCDVGNSFNKNGISGIILYKNETLLPNMY